MKPTIDVDMRQWQAAARELFQTSSRTCVDFTNGQALKVAIESVRQTYKANRTEIQRTLGAVSNQSSKLITRGRNKGRFRTKTTLSLSGRDTFAARILAARFRKTGEWGIAGDTLEERALNLIKSRIRAAGFIASGWIGARNALFSLVRKKPAGLRTIAGARQYGKPKGAARPAIFSLRSKIEAIIQNTALMAHQGKSPAPGGDPMPTAIYGLNAALRVAAADMLAELARRLQPDFRRVSAR